MLPGVPWLIVSSSKVLLTDQHEYILVQVKESSNIPLPGFLALRDQPLGGVH